MSERAKRLSRRNFFSPQVLAASPPPAAIVAKNSSSPQPTDKSKRDTRGYHASEHVNNYYRTTKV
jgi:hypothetical protein